MSILSSQGESKFRNILRRQSRFDFNCPRQKKERKKGAGHACLWISSWTRQLTLLREWCGGKRAGHNKWAIMASRGQRRFYAAWRLYELRIMRPTHLTPIRSWRMQGLKSRRIRKREMGQVIEERSVGSNKEKDILGWHRARIEHRERARERERERVTGWWDQWGGGGWGGE